ncbi:MAG TPA: hypothetical protein VNT60_09215, partial [Deinococcales bacterium]|nr:hypothetical protein [Deinococcales bacterium]
LSKNALIEGNTIWSNGFNLGYDGQAPTSTIVPPHWALGAGVYILQSDDVTIRNNLIAYNADGVTVWSDSRWDHTVSGIVVTGNDILTRQNAGSAHAIAWLTTREHAGAPQGVLGAGNRGENNRFYMEGGASLVWNNQYFPDVVSFGSTPGGIGSSLISPATATALTSGLTGI